jgi:hypothetical protein
LDSLGYKGLAAYLIATDLALATSVDQTEERKALRTKRQEMFTSTASPFSGWWGNDVIIFRQGDSSLPADCRGQLGEGTRQVIPAFLNSSSAFAVSPSASDASAVSVISREREF